MSFELEYFPPNGTKYKWESKALNYSPWFCDILGQQNYPSRFPARVVAKVDLIDGAFTWRVLVTGWDNKVTVIDGKSISGIDACIESESIGYNECEKLFPDWVVKAIENKWRPPA